MSKSKKPSSAYLWYIGLTSVLFIVLLVLGFMAQTQGWLPAR